MLVSLRKSRPPSFLAEKRPLRAKCLWWGFHPGGIVDTTTKAFVTPLPSRLKKYQRLRITHTGPYYFTRKLLIMVGLLVASAVAGWGVWFFVTRIGPDYGEVTRHKQVLVDNPNPGVPRTSSGCVGVFFQACWSNVPIPDSPNYRTETIKSVEEYSDLFTWFKNILRGLAAFVCFWYIVMPFLLFINQARVFYADLRTRFAPIDKSGVRRITGIDDSLRVFRDSLRDYAWANYSEFKEEEPPKLKKGVRSYRRTRKLASPQLNEKGRDILKMFSESLAHKSESSFITELCNNAFYQFHVSIQELVAEKQNLSQKGQARINAHIRSIADSDVEQLVSVLTAQLNEQELAQIESDNQRAALAAFEQQTEDSVVNGLIEGTQYLLK